MIKKRIPDPGIMPLPSVIASRLREEIRGGRYAVGKPILDERSLVEKFGVSRGTVRRALDILKNEQIIVRQQGRGTFVSNPAYASLTEKKVPAIGIMVAEKEYYYGPIVQSASIHSARRGYMLITGYNPTEEIETQYLDIFLKNGIKGVVIAPREHSLKTCDRLSQENIPVIFFDLLLPERQEDFISVNDRKGTEMSTRYLIGLGHRKIGYVGHDNPVDLPCRPERRAGFREACKWANLKIPADWEVEINRENPLPVLRRLLENKNRPTAVVAYNDIWAVRIIQVAEELGLKVPADLSVTGFDDESVARNYDVPVTSIHPEPKELGMAIIDFLITKIENPRPRPQYNILITPKLVIRSSTAQPPPGKQ